MVRFVLFRSERDAAPQPVSEPWEALAARLTRHEPRAGKSGPAWSPAEYRPGTTRGNNNVLAVTVAVFDVDHISAATLKEVGRQVNSSGFAYVVHSTHTHNPPADCRVRVVLPLSRPVSPVEWARLRPTLISHLRLPADPATKDAARLYYLPSAPLQGPKPLAVQRSGAPVDVDRFLASALPEASQSPEPSNSPALVGGTVPCSPPAGGAAVDLEPLRTTLRRVTRKETKDVVAKILKGEALATTGGRDKALNQAASILSTTLPLDTPISAMVDILRPSLFAMPLEPEGAEHWLEEVGDMLERARERRVEREAETAKRNAGILKGFMQAAGVMNLPPASEPDATGNVITPPEFGPYTEAEIEAWGREQGCSTYAEFERRWIIQRTGQFYVFANGKYLPPISEKDLSVSLPRDLSRAPISLSRPTKEGFSRPAKVSELLADYATVARHVEASLVLQRSYYDARTQTFYEAVRPLRHIRPREHRDINEWLALLGGEDADALLDWVATSHRLERASAALYIEGSPGAGKNLIASGLARLWTTGSPSDLNAVLSDYNSVLTICPLVYADEALPKSPNRNTTADLRKLIGSLSRTLSRKYFADATLHGAIRVIMGANNDRMLDTGEDLSANDLQAVAGRFLHIKAGPAATAYLERKGAVITRRWVEEDQIAEHALFLAQSRQVEEGRRFLVEGRTTDLHEHLAVSSGVASAVCEWLTGYLMSPAGIDKGPAGHLIKTGAGELLVSPSVMADSARWGLYVPAARLPGTGQIGRALRNLSSGTINLEHKGERFPYYRVRAALVTSWAQRNQIGDVDKLRERVERPAPDITAALGRAA